MIQFSTENNLNEYTLSIEQKNNCDWHMLYVFDISFVHAFVRYSLRVSVKPPVS